MSLIITPRALERQGKLVFEGWGYRMFLANDALSALTNASSAEDWLELEVSGNGYEPVTGVIGSGAFNAGNGRWEQPSINWSFASAGAGYTFTHRCLLLSRINTASIESGAIAANVATIVTTMPHGFEVGDQVVIAGASGGFNGTRTITTTPAWDSFTFALTAANAGSSAIGGTVTKTTPETYLEALKAYSPAVILSAGQTRGGTFRLSNGV